MSIDDDENDIKFDYREKNYAKKTTIIKGVITIIVGLLFCQLTILIPLIAIIIGGLMIFFASKKKHF
jgi:hypothetical protein